MLSISVGDAPAELRASVLAMKRADKRIRSEISRDMRATMSPEWKSEVTQGLTGGRMESRMLLPGTRIAAGNPPTLIAASGGRRVGNGLIPNVNAPGYEFGSHGTRVSTVTSSLGKKFKRHTTRHLPGFVKTGRVVYPAAARILPRVASYWVQSVVRAFMDAAEGK